MKILDPYGVPGTFRKAQLHAHTTHSDGRLAPEDILERYRARGFTFVCLTDHDRVTRCDALDGPDFLAVPGIEETVVRGIHPLGAHLGRLLVDGRIGRGSARERVETTWREGGVPVLNHPSWKGNLWTGEWTPAHMRAMAGPFFVEIVNPHSETVEDVRRWATALRTRTARTTVGGVAGDDAHAPHQIGRAWVMVRVNDVSEEALRTSLRAMAFYATTGPAVDLRIDREVVRVSGEIAAARFVDREGRIRAEIRGTDAWYAPVGDEGFIRVEARDGGSGRVWSQPFWIEPSEGSDA